VPAFAQIARKYARAHTRVEVLPVGASHPVSTVTRAEARRELNIPDDRVVIGVFSPAASGFLVDWIAAAAERLRSRKEVLWLLLGFGSDGSAAGLPAGDHVRRLGALDRARLGRALRALDLAAQPYTDGLTMRRSGAMLVLAHGVPMVSSTGEHLDPACARVAACEASADAFAARLEQLVMNPAVRAEWAARAANSADVSSVGPLADAIVRDLAA
jgi:polysaccharide biosynthesis protein PslF